jgi:hypothetical protein
MIKNLIGFILDQKIKGSYNQKRKQYKKNIPLGVADQGFTKLYKNQWSRLHSSFDCDYPHFCSKINAVDSINYVPENIYYSRIEATLNNKAFALAYADKNFYETYFPENREIFPETVLRGINGYFYDGAYRLLNDPVPLKTLLSQDANYILKPAVETSGGSNVVLAHYTGDTVIISDKVYQPTEFIDYLRKVYHCNFVLQKRAHKWFADFNPSSLNTIRLFTYRSVNDQTVHPVQAVIRFGRPGSIVDNQAAGGLTCGITRESKLNNFVIDKYGRKLTDFPFLSTKKDDPIPGFEEMKEIARQLAKKYYYHRLLGFDFCYDAENRVRLLEINCKNIEINFLQMNNGPLFWDFTDEIIGYCSTNKRSVVLDFYI